MSAGFVPPSREVAWAGVQAEERAWDARRRERVAFTAEGATTQGAAADAGHPYLEAFGADPDAHPDLAFYHLLDEGCGHLTIDGARELHALLGHALAAHDALR